MATKIKAAQLASAAGIATLITATARAEEVVAKLSAMRRLNSGAVNVTATTGARVFSDSALGTTLLPSPHPLKGRKRWILGLAPAGSVSVDAGAAAALLARKSLFPAGVRAVTGAFDSHDAVAVCDEAGTEIARVLVNYSSSDLRKILGRQSHELASLLGFEGTETAADRDNITLLAGGVEDA